MIIFIFKVYSNIIFHSIQINVRRYIILDCRNDRGKEFQKNQNRLMRADGTSRFSNSIDERFDNLSMFTRVYTGLIDSLKRVSFYSNGFVQVGAHNIFENLVISEWLSLAVHSRQIKSRCAVIFIINY